MWQGGHTQSYCPSHKNSLDQVKNILDSGLFDTSGCIGLSPVLVERTHKIAANFEFFRNLNDSFPNLPSSSGLDIIEYLLDPSTDFVDSCVGLRSAYHVVYLGQKWKEGLRKSYKQVRKQTWIRECNQARLHGSDPPIKPPDNESPDMTQFESKLVDLIDELEVQLGKFKTFVFQYDNMVESMLTGFYD
ncbi:hypothetical protein GEMRC1_003111 [Eukaryota sp. GEM-RC1]